MRVIDLVFCPLNITVNAIGSRGDVSATRHEDGECLCIFQKKPIRNHTGIVVLQCFLAIIGRYVLTPDR